jgi:hypothetical protein
MSVLTVRAGAYRGPCRRVAVSRARAGDRRRSRPPRKFPWTNCVVVAGFYVEGNRHELGIHSVSQLPLASIFGTHCIGTGLVGSAGTRSGRVCPVLAQVPGVPASPAMLEAGWCG